MDTKQWPFLVLVETDEEGARYARRHLLHTPNAVKLFSAEQLTTGIPSTLHQEARKDEP